MSKKDTVETEVKEPEEANPIFNLANRIARSTIAVIDTVVQRGGFKGEELSTVGQLRDQCVDTISLAEAETLRIASET